MPTLLDPQHLHKITSEYSHGRWDVSLAYSTDFTGVIQSCVDMTWARRMTQGIGYQWQAVRVRTEHKLGTWARREARCQSDIFPCMPCTCFSSCVVVLFPDFNAVRLVRLVLWIGLAVQGHPTAQRIRHVPSVWQGIVAYLVSQAKFGFVGWTLWDWVLCSAFWLESNTLLGSDSCTSCVVISYAIDNLSVEVNWCKKKRAKSQVRNYCV